MGIYTTLFTLAILICLLEMTYTGDVFTSTAQMRKLLVSEDILKSGLDVYISSEEKRLAELKRLRSAVNSQSKDADDDNESHDAAGDIARHPVKAYSVIKNFLQTYKEMGSMEKVSANYREFQALIEASGVYLPDDTDMEGAAAAIIRLQRVYKVSTDDLAAGVVMGHQVSSLQADDCFHMGKTAFEQGEYNLAVQWFHKALELNSTFTSRSGESPISECFFQIAKSYYEISDFANAVDFTLSAMEHKPDDEFLQSYLGAYQHHLVTAQEEGKPLIQNMTNWTRSEEDWQIIYAALCRGEKLKPRKIEDRLVCRYRSTAIPFYKVKEEIHSYSPHIVLLYDVIFDHEAEYIQSTISNRLERATVGDPALRQTTESRISKVGWMWDHLDGEIIQGLSRRVALITGLDTTYRDILSSAEPFQVVNYGLAGQYEPHVDYYQDPVFLKNNPTYLIDAGDRIATFLFYLTDVPAGGATVFTKAFTHIPPTKGAAAFWYNSMKTGEYDIRTEHAGCPVLLGEKWVANKWIHEVGQQFKRPCGMSYSQKYTVEE